MEGGRGSRRICAVLNLGAHSIWYVATFAIFAGGVRAEEGDLAPRNGGRTEAAKDGPRTRDGR